MTLDSTTLLQGPRGRRVVLDYVLACEDQRVGENEDTARSLRYLVCQAAEQLVPSPDSRRYATRTSADPDPHSEDDSPPDPESTITPAEVADQVRRTTLLPPDPTSLLTALTTSVESAMYWQHAAGEDTLAATRPVREALTDAARLIAESAHTHWWNSPTDLGDQWFVYWGSCTEDRPSMQRPGLKGDDVLEELSAWRHRRCSTEWKRHPSAADDPLSAPGGEWWTTPPAPALPSTRIFPGAAMPVGVPLKEDRFGDCAYAVSYSPPPRPNVYEINGPADWARLCNDFPLDQTFTLRREWFRATGRDGRWTVPDWSAVAREWDGVHLTVAGYLSTATFPIPLSDDKPDPHSAHTMMAGLSPDETWWFRERPSGPFTGEVHKWSECGDELTPFSTPREPGAGIGTRSTGGPTGTGS